MRYRLIETKEAVGDVQNLVRYILVKFNNKDAAINLLDRYDIEVQKLLSFPQGYRGIGVEYRGYEIRIKSFETYNIFFVISEKTKKIVVLRVLKNSQNWKRILKIETEYHF